MQKKKKKKKKNNNNKKKKNKKKNKKKKRAGEWFLEATVESQLRSFGSFVETEIDNGTFTGASSVGVWEFGRSRHLSE